MPKGIYKRKSQKPEEPMLEIGTQTLESYQNHIANLSSSLQDRDEFIEKLRKQLDSQRRLIKTMARMIYETL